MKKFIGIFSLVLVLAMTLSVPVFAAGSNEFTITTDKTSVAAGETVLVTVDASGDWADVAMVSLSIKFDADKFSAVTSGRAPWCFDSTWYNSTKDGNPANLGYINTPSVGENPKGQLNVGYISTDGYTIDDGGELYGGGETTIAVIKFTATADVDVIDSKCFELMDICQVESDSLHTLTLNQLASAGGEEPAGNKMVALVDTGVVETELEDGWQKGQGIAATFNVADIKDFTAMNWVLTCENIAAPKYAKVDNFAELIAAIGEESTVQFVATFVVNAIENEVETVYGITDVAAGFKPVEGEPVIFTAE